MTVLAWPGSNKKTLLPKPGGGAAGGSLMTIQEWERRWFFPPPHFPFDYKTVAHLSSLGIAPSWLPACKLHKHLILINYFLSITLPLAEFFVLRYKGPEFPRAPGKPPSSFNVTLGEVTLPWPIVCSPVKQVRTPAPHVSEGFSNWRRREAGFGTFPFLTLTTLPPRFGF